MAPLKITAGLLYVIYLAASGWSLLAVLQLVVLMGHGSGMYSDYGRDSGEAILAYGFLAALLIWLGVGTVIAVKVLRQQLDLRWLGAAAVGAMLIILPVTFIYLLGV